MFSSKYNKLIKLTLFAIIIALVFLGQLLNLTYDKPYADQRQNLAYAYNSLKHGIYDQTSSEHPTPDYRREPLYPFVLIISMILNPYVDLSIQNARCITLGKGCLEKIISIKITNLLFLILTAAISGYLVYIYCKSFVPAVICFLLVSLSGSLGFLANTFYSETFVALLILVLSYTFYLLIKNKFRLKMLILFGLLLGFIALTKAIFLYFIIISCCYIFFKSYIDGTEVQSCFKRSLIVLIISLCLIGPWMIRNYIQLGTFSLAGGSGVVLLTRANYNDITDDDYLKFLLFNLRGLGEWIGKKLSIDIDRKSLEKTFKKKYKYSATKFRRTISKELRLSKRNPKLNEMMVQSAKDRMINNFSNHLQMVLPIFIRGSFPEIGYGYIPNSEYWYHGIKREKKSLGIEYIKFDISKIWISLPTISNIIYFIAFYLVIFISLIKKKWDLISFLLPSFYVIIVYSFFTHFIPRYSVPLIPIFAICSTVLIYKLQKYLRLFVSKTN